VPPTLFDHAEAFFLENWRLADRADRGRGAGRSPSTTGR